LVALNGGTHVSDGHWFVLGGSAIDPNTGRGTDRPVQTGGVLFEATNAASMNVRGNAFRLDTALLEATAPIIRLVSTGTTPTALTTGISTMDIFQSQVTSVGPVVALDNGLINVNRGPLLNVTGSNMTVAGDLLSLLNGSRINVFNGPLISVSGSGSALNVSGALVFFGGTGGNQIVVNNTISPTATMSGLPVNTSAGGTVSVGPNPVTNPSLGSLTVSNGGSLIQATNGGSVSITAP
jgi:hypothetical protein